MKTTERHKVGSNLFAKLGIARLRDGCLRSRPRWTDVTFMRDRQVKSWLIELDALSNSDDVFGLLRQVFDTQTSRTIITGDQLQ
jgi:hypothetical protein